MAHIRDHKEFTSSVLRGICDDALSSLPDSVRDTAALIDDRRATALEHLFSKVESFCGVSSGFPFRYEAINAAPADARHYLMIVDVINFDMVHYHAGFRIFNKDRILLEYLEKCGVGVEP